MEKVDQGGKNKAPDTAFDQKSQEIFGENLSNNSDFLKKQIKIMKILRKKGGVWTHNY